MKTCGTWPIGVCSWCIPGDVADQGAALRRLGVSHVHLAVGPAAEDPGYLPAVRKQGWTVTSTMIGFPQEDYSTLERIRATGGIAPDEHWETNREIVVKAAATTAQLQVPYLSMHAGFIDHADPAYARTFCDRLRELADVAAGQGIMLLLETGQESARDLKTFLTALNHDAVGINFDPANMILYNKGEPVEALRMLAPWVRHVHVKDAVRPATAGAWGREVPWSTGDVGAKVFLDALRDIGYEGALAIEREGGASQLADIGNTVTLLSADQTTGGTDDA